MYRILIGILFMYPLLLGALPTETDAPSTPETTTAASPAVVSNPAVAASPIVSIPVLSINGAIGPAVSDYLTREISQINLERQAPLILLTIDTPGGLSSSLRDINQRILSSDIPLACLVYPQGARAASAGTYILYACHVAAMATATTLGAATPVMMASPISPSKEDSPDKTKPSAMENKVLNDSIAYIRSLAQLRKRNAEWAELAVSEAATLTAEEALQMQVIDLMADSPEQLRQRLNDPKLRINQQQQAAFVNQQGQAVDLSQAILDYRQPDWRSQFIATITDPNMAYILMLVGIYGLLLEFYSPGIGVAGSIGAISLFIGLYALQMLPLNYAGLGLLFLGIAFLVVEAMIPSFGVFGLSGLVAFVIGSIFLIDTEQSQFRVSWQLILPVAISSGLFFVFLLGYLWQIRKNKVVSGPESMLGAPVTVLDAFSDQGYVALNGERWAANTEQPLKQGQTAYVAAIDGLTLKVSHLNPSGGSHARTDP